ncbi:MAG: DegT/DnrJ/EryC1/StrS family aminotransferase [Candidatus Omnitrophica bacterium]|nr:DegT/DnrJ/EryC1/StrS family aminotransferase [Candidatus Omnitrophota bacterium]
MNVPFLDLTTQHKEISIDAHAAFERVFGKSNFILGEDEVRFEEEFAAYCGTKFAVGVNSGTDALVLGLLSSGIGPGDEVIVPAFTFIASASAVSMTGAKPVFVDSDEKTFTLDVDKIESLINKKTKAIMPVHLFGQTADMGRIMKIARKHNLKIIEDAAQAHGALYYQGAVKTASQGKKAGSIGDVGCFSFYPTKNLGAFGDAGIAVTNDKNIYRKLLLYRDNGRKSKYEHILLGYNSRLDTLQAAFLRAKLPHLDRWNDARRKIAKTYNTLLKDIVEIMTPMEADFSHHVYHVYSILVKNRDKVVGCLKSKGVGVMVHYPLPLHLQKAYKFLKYSKGDFPVAEKVSKQIISLPMHPVLTVEQVLYVTECVKNAVKQ